MIPAVCISHHVFFFFIRVIFNSKTFGTATNPPSAAPCLMHGLTQRLCISMDSHRRAAKTTAKKYWFSPQRLLTGRSDCDEALGAECLPQRATSAVC